MNVINWKEQLWIYWRHFPTGFLKKSPKSLSCRHLEDICRHTLMLHYLLRPNLTHLVQFNRAAEHWRWNQQDHLKLPELRHIPQELNHHQQRWENLKGTYRERVVSPRCIIQEDIFGWAVKYWESGSVLFLLNPSIPVFTIRILSDLPNPQAWEGPHLIGCPQQLFQYIRCYPAHWRPLLFPQHEEAPCSCDRDVWYLF